MGSRTRPGFTVVELLVSVSLIAILAGILLPTMGKARDATRINVSRSNLRQVGIALRTYASDWSDRQLTYVRDNLGQYGGDLAGYNQAVYGAGAGNGLDMHPPIIAGWAYNSAGEWSGPWAYWPTQGNRIMFQPINFPESPMGCSMCSGWGWFRMGIQTKPINCYLNGRFHDLVFYAPKDRANFETAERCAEVPGEFVAVDDICSCGPWPSYCLSPAALFAPQVFSDDGQGRFWNAPWTMAAGYRVPSFGQVRYPELKTHALEHHWLQNAAFPCNDAFFGCEPYYFNHSFRSAPVTLFYDGSVRLMTVLEAMSSDRRHQHQAGHGLWSRDTPFGEGGYFIAEGHDYASTSYHILTTEGVRGRDTVGSE